MRVVFVHGACVKGGSWWWRRTGALLDAAKVSSVSPALPSCGETGRGAGNDGPGYDDDVTAVRAALTESEEPTIIVAHSYGGMVIAEAALGVESVQQLVYVSSYLPEPGESLASFAGSEPAPFLSVDIDAGTFAVRSEMLADIFMHDCVRDIPDALVHLAPQSASVAGHPVRASAWKHVPSTYLVCANDRGTPADKQRQFAAKAGHVIELDTGHHPFLARPQDVAEILLELATKT